MEATINKKEKNISIEILRIVSMLMIIVLHFFSYTNATENLQVFSIKYFATEAELYEDPLATNTIFSILPLHWDKHSNCLG